jgi:cell division protein FtsI (penicillin-binding protein 3)
VAQQVLEYLGVAHDIDVRVPRAGSKAAVRMEEDDAGQNEGDITALYAAANDLPSDDPLRDAPASQPQQAPAAPAVVPRGSAAAQPPPANGLPLALKQPQLGAEITLSDAKRLRVPSLIGLPIRKVIELSGAAGLEVEISGNGSVRQQAPAAGTLVAPGTKIVVRCGR